MKTIQTVSEMQGWSEEQRLARKTIGFVPTMGFLHEGHLSLVRDAKKRSDVVVVSIFVNPMQFNQSSDFDAYPRDEEQDERYLQELGTDVLFMPPPSEIYPDGYQSAVEVEKVSLPLCGAFRPGHFRGVTTVVAKLFNMVKPRYAMFGEKDFQQCVVIKRMVKDLNFDLEIVTIPTIREDDGLAMSSRNARLSGADREKSLCVSRALKIAQEAVSAGQLSADAILQSVQAVLTHSADVRVEYASLCHPETLEDVDHVSGPTLLAIAVWLGGVRLIDNCVLQ